ncbi:hypothetical protein KQX54_017675 [Cotesia glomerata]|uniref:Uncharacterized protein n=1 Tax=Cotesia glomerata TaxID=32391 RepID=A0AAV7I7I0_COTGL|nr:hypothetical protein KQX54_017675 [Cotesia glomerata]
MHEFTIPKIISDPIREERVASNRVTGPQLDQFTNQERRFDRHLRDPKTQWQVQGQPRGAQVRPLVSPERGACSATTVPRGCRHQDYRPHWNILLHLPILLGKGLLNELGFPPEWNHHRSSCFTKSFYLQPSSNNPNSN